MIKFKQFDEGKKDKEAEMFAWVIDKMENSNHNHGQLKKEFTKTFGAAATKTHWDDMVTMAMGD